MMEDNMNNKHLVLQTDFGLVDGAVSAMQGVAYTVAPEVTISNLTHEIEPYNINDASYRLLQTVAYWPAKTVFVSVVDPGVRSEERRVGKASRRPRAERAEYSNI